MAEIKQIIRIANVDVDGERAIYHQLTKIKGVGTSYSNMICNLLGGQKDKKVGELTESELAKIKAAVENHEKINAPAWMLNRRNDPETGKNAHIITNDLKFIQDNDIKLMKKIKSYKGVRHASGLPVRGQRTKSNFRKNKGKATGVVKGAKAKAPAAAE